MNEFNEVFFFSNFSSSSPEEFFNGIGIGGGHIQIGDGELKSGELNTIFDLMSEGRFIACTVDDESGEAYVKTDSFGAESIFIYKDAARNRWALSNSLQYLAERVSSFY